MEPDEIEKEAQDLLRRYRSLQALDGARSKKLAKYSEEDFLAIRRCYALLWLDTHGKPSASFQTTISPEKREENRTKRVERKRKMKEGLLVMAKKKLSKKRGGVSISLPSSKRSEQEEEHKLPPARIIYTPMGNKR